jgi:hypothetical protein
MFESSKIKINRAKKHALDLDPVLNAFMQSDYYRLWVDKQDGVSIIKFQMTKKLPEEIPLIVGDAIHNLRAALDFMAYDIIQAAGKSPDRHAHFPVREKRHDVVSAINGGDIKFAPIPVVNAIVDGVKPYKGGNDALWGLHQLDLIDKHRLLIPHASFTFVTGVSARGAGFSIINDNFAVDGGGELATYRIPGDVEITGHNKPGVGVFFDKGFPFEKDPVYPLLLALTNSVSEAISIVERAYA